MITIHNEVTIDVGNENEQTMTLWLVSYGAPTTAQVPKGWPMLVKALCHFCRQRGWEIEVGTDDPYHDKSLAILAEGFSWPPDDDEDSDADEYLARHGMN